MEKFKHNVNIVNVILVQNRLNRAIDMVKHMRKCTNFPHLNVEKGQIILGFLDSANQ